MPEPTKPSNAYDAFNSVDKLVSKPIMGSDGAASWQAFRKDKSKTIYNKASSAPLAPLKKADKLGSGLKSWEDERRREEEARKETGAAALGEGYTNFKAKNGQEEALARKEKKRIEKKIRPDKAEYFLPAKTFEGWKWDYVFTTKDRGTGYYWDGSDSLKRLKGELPATEGPENTSGKEEEEQDDGTANKRSANSNNQEETKQRKKKKQKKSGPVILDDPNNPLEQVQAVLRARNERLSQNNLPPGWEAASDPTTKKVYYYHRESGTRQWEKPQPETLPDGWSTAQDPSGKTYYFHKSGTRQWEKPIDDAEKVPAGWSVAKDAAGKTYYYHKETGQTSWEKPTR